MNDPRVVAAREMISEMVRDTMTAWTAEAEANGGRCPRCAHRVADLNPPTAHMPYCPGQPCTCEDCQR